MNFAILLGGISVYVASRFFLISRIPPGIWTSHGHDCLATLVLLAASNLYIEWLRAPSFAIVRPLPAAAIATAAGLFWEYVTPRYRHSTGDPLDLVAYLVGALLYCVIIRSGAIAGPSRKAFLRAGAAVLPVSSQ